MQNKINRQHYITRKQYKSKKMKRPCKVFTHTGMTLDSWEFHLTIKIKL